VTRANTDGQHSVNAHYSQPLLDLSDQFSVLLVEFGSDPELRDALVAQLWILSTAPPSLNAQQLLSPPEIQARIDHNLNDEAFISAASYLYTLPVMGVSRWQQIEARLKPIPILYPVVEASYRLYRALLRLRSL
jgi:hypothetical protein